MINNVNADANVTLITPVILDPVRMAPAVFSLKFESCKSLLANTEQTAIPVS